MHTGFDILESSSALRRHWVRRFVAGFIDIGIVFIPLWVVLNFLTLTDRTIAAGLGAGLLWFLYAGLMEGYFGRTIGKMAVHLKVVSMRDRRTLKQTFIRSIPKLFWYIFLPFDVAVGLATEGDPRKRWSDGVARTLVIAYYPSVPRSKKVPKAQPRMHHKEGKTEL
jgi:uncharacterized RDD family membrane protein YckC